MKLGGLILTIVTLAILVASLIMHSYAISVAALCMTAGNLISTFVEKNVMLLLTGICLNGVGVILSAMVLLGTLLA